MEIIEGERAYWVVRLHRAAVLQRLRGVLMKPTLTSLLKTAVGKTVLGIALLTMGVGAAAAAGGSSPVLDGTPPAVAQDDDDGQADDDADETDDDPAVAHDEGEGDAGKNERGPERE